MARRRPRSSRPDEMPTPVAADAAGAADAPAMPEQAVDAAPPAEPAVEEVANDAGPSTSGAAEVLLDGSESGATPPAESQPGEVSESAAVGSGEQATEASGEKAVAVEVLTEVGVSPSATGAVDGPAPLELKFVLESLLFSAQKALTTRELKDFLAQAAQDEEAPEALVFKKVREDDILRALEELQREHETAGRSYRLLCVAGAWQFASVPRYAPWLRALLGRKARPPRLSQPGIETLTIIAYRQPVTRAEIEQIRGVSVDGVMQTLLERGLIEGVGRAEAIGRPVTYGTTPMFLEYFGLRALEDLPAAEELRRIPVQKPEALLTVDPGLATAPADVPAPAQELAAVDPAAATTPPPAAASAEPSAPAAS